MAADIFLGFHAELALIGKKAVIVEDRRRPPIPGLIVVAEGIEKLPGGKWCGLDPYVAADQRTLSSSHTQLT